MNKGELTYKFLNKWFHRVDVILDFEMWEHNNWGEEYMIVVNKKQNTYMYAHDDFRTIIYNTNDYEWYKIKE